MQRIIQSTTRAISSRIPQRLSSSTSPSRKNFQSSLTSSFTTTPTRKMASNINAQSVLDQIKNRRTYYPLSKDLTISTARVQEIVQESVQHVPSSFNSQSNRAVVLFGDAHEKLWDITTEILQAIVPAESFAATAGRMAMFKGSSGTVLFFEDQTVVEAMQANVPLYAEHFPTWATQSNAMLQFAVWVALEAEGLGANLQHYNPIINAKVAEEWKIPSTWKLSAQLVFGGKTGEAGDKEFAPVEEKVKAYGA